MSEGLFRENLISFVAKYSSRFMGVFAALQLPRPVLWLLFRVYSKVYGVNESESELPFSHYTSFDGFFTRNLVAGSRHVDEASLVSPVDAVCSQIGISSSGELIQAKGVNYTLEGLLGNKDLSREFEGGYYSTFYLAPGDYHHIHSPITATLRRRLYIPGALFPVNTYAVNNIPNLFCKNERVVLVLDSPKGAVAVVMVGAMNVGSIGVECEPEFRSKVLSGDAIDRDRSFDPQISISIGDRIGTFHLGSTVILLLDRSSFESYMPSQSNFLGHRVFWGNSLC